MTGIIIAAVIIGLVCLVGGAVLFMLLPLMLALAGLVVLVLAMVVVAIMLLPSFITLDDLKPEILSLVRETTGREITIGGPIGFSVWPVLGLHLRDISIGNPSGFTDPIMLSAQELSVGVTLKSLLSHKLDLREFRLNGGQINLSVNEEGRGNWVMVPAGGTESPDNQKSGRSISIQDINIQAVEIRDTDLSFDSASGRSFDLTDMDMTFGMGSLDSEASLAGDMSYNGQNIDLKVVASSLRQLAGGEGSKVEIGLSANGIFRLALTGEAGKQGIKQGDITVDVGDIGNVIKLVNAETGPLPYRELSLKSGLSVTPAALSLEGMTLRLDDLSVSGKAGLGWLGTVPKLTADVDVGQLNLDRYAIGENGNGSSSGDPAGTQPDLGGLNRINANVTARLAGLAVKGAELGATTAKLSLQNGRLEASITPASLFGGTVAGKTSLNAANRSFTANATLENVDMEPVLTRFAAYDRLTGRGDATLSLSGPLGNTSELDGSGRAMLRDGALKGINLAAVMRRAKAMLSASAAPEESGPVQTDFTELSGTFRIDNGVASNNDLKMLSPLLRVTGKGTANLVNRTVNYRVDTALVADLTGQGGVLQRKGLVIPINIIGPFDNLSYVPDLQGLVLGNAEVAGQAVEAIRNMNPRDVREGAKGAISNLLGGGQSPQDGQTQPAPNPLQNLFGR